MMKPSALALLFFGFAFGQGTDPSIDLAKQAWHGQAICYSGYRVGQDPDKGIFPTRGQVLEDLRILEKNWQFIRLYGSDQHSKDVLEVIKQNDLHLKVMLGMWVSGKPEKQAENRRQLAFGIQLAKDYPTSVVAVSVGNEALVSWSNHRMTEEAMLDCVRQVKAAVPCRVTVADDFGYWVQPGNKLVKLLDFITLHTYPLFGKQDIDEGIPTTFEKFEQVHRLYPGKAIVFGEVGWASYTDSNPQHVARGGSERKQQRYYEEVSNWARGHAVTTFFFEAFDEPWKGEGTEGHWGFFSVDRKAKLVMQKLFPDLMPTGPTSPGYEAASSPRADAKEKLP